MYDHVSALADALSCSVLRSVGRWLVFVQEVLRRPVPCRAARGCFIIHVAVTGHARRGVKLVSAGFLSKCILLG